MKLQYPVCLGIFGEDLNSLGFTLLAKNEVNGDIGVGVVSCFYTLIKNRVFYIYLSKTYDNASDIQWSRDNLTAWKNVILNAN